MNFFTDTCQKVQLISNADYGLIMHIHNLIKCHSLNQTDTPKTISVTCIWLVNAMNSEG